MKTENTDIYIDLKALHALLYRAQFTMTKGDRIIMGNRLLDLSQNTVSFLSRAVNCANYSERLEYMERMLGEFDALRLNLQTAADLHMFKEKLATVDRESGNSQRVSPIVLSIFERVAKIDEGMGKWRSATKSRLSLNKRVAEPSGIKETDCH